MSYRIVVYRPSKSKPNTMKSEWLKGGTDRDDVAAEAAALLADPKDTIVCVKVWNERHQQFEPLTFEAGWSWDGTHKLADGEVDRAA